MPILIQGTVGCGGANRPDDVRAVQEVLKKVPASLGGSPNLRVDPSDCPPAGSSRGVGSGSSQDRSTLWSAGLNPDLGIPSSTPPSSATVAAIEEFQRYHFGLRGATGRLVPNDEAVLLLAEFDTPAPPLRPFESDYMIEGAILDAAYKDPEPDVSRVLDTVIKYRDTLRLYTRARDSYQGDPRFTYLVGTQQKAALKKAYEEALPVLAPWARHMRATRDATSQALVQQWDCLTKRRDQLMWQHAQKLPYILSRGGEDLAEDELQEIAGFFGIVEHVSRGYLETCTMINTTHALTEVAVHSGAEASEFLIKEFSAQKGYFFALMKRKLHNAEKLCEFVEEHPIFKKVGKLEYMGPAITIYDAFQADDPGEFTYKVVKAHLEGLALVAGPYALGAVAVFDMVEILVLDPVKEEAERGNAAVRQMNQMAFERFNENFRGEYLKIRELQFLLDQINATSMAMYANGLDAQLDGLIAADEAGSAAISQSPRKINLPIMDPLRDAPRRRAGSR